MKKTPRQVILAIFALACALNATGQRQQAIKPTPKERARAEAQLVELKKLRDQYVAATKEYKASVERLLGLYQDSVRKSEERVAQSQKLSSDGLLTDRELDQAKQTLASAKMKVGEVEAQIASADTQIADALKELDKEATIDSLVKEYRRESAHRPTCREWKLTAYSQQRAHTSTFAFKFVCKY